MTSQTQTIPNYEVHCDRCKWWGYMYQLVTVYVPTVDDISAEPGCPHCLADSAMLEFSEQNIGRLEKALTNLEQTTKQFNQAMENLHCQISHQQS